MKSTLKIISALMGLLISFSPAMAGGKSKPWKHQSYCDPVDIACQMSNGQWNHRRKKKVVVRRGPDCGEADAETARGLNVVSSVAGLAPVPGIGVIFGIAAGEASAQADKKQWNCFERNVKRQLAFSVREVERQAKDHIDQVERYYAEQMTKMQNAFEKMVAEHTATIARIEQRVANANTPPDSTMQMMWKSICVSNPEICGVSGEPEAYFGPEPADEKPSADPSAGRGAPALDPKQRQMATFPFTDFAGSLGQSLPSR